MFEEIMLEALLKGHEAVKELIAFKKKSLRQLGKKKVVELLHVDAGLQAEITEASQQRPASIRVEEN